MELLLRERVSVGLDCRWDTIERMLTAVREKQTSAARSSRVFASLAVVAVLSSCVQAGAQAANPQPARAAPVQSGPGQAIPGRAAPGQATSGQATSGQVTSGQASPVQPVARFVVVIDAAHGGEDSGAQLAGAVAEKTVTLAMSVRLRSLLTARGFQVVTTREGNVKLDPDARAQIANRAGAGGGAAACLSLHASEAGNGVHIFVSSLAPAAPTRFLAWKTAQSAYVTRSLQLASVVNSGFERGSDAGPIVANLARTSLPGVDSMACPAVALEIAPVRDSDGQVETEATDADYQSRIVDALAAALLEWRTNWEGNPHPAAPRPIAPPAPNPVPNAAPKAVAPATKPAGGAKQP
jgi:N-acetylmuramoyl-L-alanine amidase